MKWLEPQKLDIPQKLMDSVPAHPLVLQSLVRKGLVEPRAALAFLDPEQYVPTAAEELPDIDVAVRRIRAAISAGERILVWGDFDVDGLTATAILVNALRGLGGEVLWHVPNRRIESHGVHWSSLQPFLARGVRLLVTCDTGVSAHQEALLAQNAGLDVVITDHHRLPAELPAALAVVNPNRLAADHPLRFLSGAAVASKMAEALCAPDKGADLVALGLVADVVPHRGDVRYLIQRGLEALRQSERTGILALLEVAELDPARLGEDDISYGLAPRLNALGRLGDASSGVELFLTDDVVRARTIAAELEALNVRRQFLSRQVTTAARKQVEQKPSLAAGPLLMVSHADWPAGVLGIAASRLAERYGKPAVVVCMPEGQPARGSARSVPGIDVHAALASQQHLLERFGGHAMAAGFSVAAERLPELYQGLARAVEEIAGDALPERELAIHAYSSLPELGLDLVDELGRLAPFGPGNEPPVLATRGVHVTQQRTIGRTGEHRRLQIQDELGCTQTAVWWNSADDRVPANSFDLAYILRENEFQGERSLQLEWVDARLKEGPTVEIVEAPPSVDIGDYRQMAQPVPVLQALWEPEVMQLWVEGARVPGLTGQGRHELFPGKHLVVWTVPPGPGVWRRALRRVRPQQAYLFAVRAPFGEVDSLLEGVAGLVRHALKAYGGRLDWPRMAQALAHREETVQAGVRWLVARGQVTLVGRERDAWVVTRGGERDEEAELSAYRALCEHLHETAAYRQHFQQADAWQLVSDGLGSAKVSHG